MNQLARMRSRSLPIPVLVAGAGDQARVRFPEFFAANISNTHTRCAYSGTVGEYLAWCADAGVPSIAHVATWIQAQTRELAAPSVKQFCPIHDALIPDGGTAKRRSLHPGY